MMSPTGVAFGPDDDVIVADTKNERIQVREGRPGVRCGWGARAPHMPACPVS